MNSYHKGKQAAIDRFEVNWMTGMAILCDFDMSKIALEGGLHLTTVYRLARKHGISRMDLLERINPESPDEAG